MGGIERKKIYTYFLVFRNNISLWYTCEVEVSPYFFVWSRSPSVDITQKSMEKPLLHTYTIEKYYFVVCPKFWEGTSSCIQSIIVKNGLHSVFLKVTLPKVVIYQRNPKKLEEESQFTKIKYGKNHTYKSR